MGGYLLRSFGPAGARGMDTQMKNPPRYGVTAAACAFACTITAVRYSEFALLIAIVGSFVTLAICTFIAAD
jgi:hypothetical protein